MAKARFCLVVDTEADFWRYIPSPHFSRKDLIRWKVNKLLGGLRFAKGRKGLVNIVKLLKKHEFPATFTIVGHLYLKEYETPAYYEEILYEAKWLRRLIGKAWLYWDPKSNFRFYPGLYMGDFIEKEMKEPYFDLGLHAFSHESLTLESEEVVNAIIMSAVKAARTSGVKAVSFGAPFNMVEDVNDPRKVYVALKKNGIKIVRYAGKEDGLKQMHETGIKNVFNKYGMKVLQVSHYFEGTSSLLLVKKILTEIKDSIGKDVVYCLCTHDFTHKNVKNLQIILKTVKRLEKEGKIELVNMEGLLK